MIKIPMYSVIQLISLTPIAMEEKNGQRFKCNDKNVNQVSEEQVLASDAYLLFYRRLPLMVSNTVVADSNTFELVDIKFKLLRKLVT